MTYLHHSVLLLLLLLLSPTLLVGISQGEVFKASEYKDRPGAAHVHLSCGDGAGRDVYERKICGATAIGEFTLISDPRCFKQFYQIQGGAACSNTTAIFSFNLDLRASEKNKVDVWVVTDHDYAVSTTEFAIYLYTNKKIPESDIALAKPHKTGEDVIVTGWGYNENHGISFVRMETSLSPYTSGCKIPPNPLKGNNWACARPKSNKDGNACRYDFGGPVYQSAGGKGTFSGWVSSTKTRGDYCVVDSNILLTFDQTYIDLMKKRISPSPKVDPKMDSRKNTHLGSPAPSLFFFPLPLVSLSLVQFFFW